MGNFRDELLALAPVLVLFLSGLAALVADLFRKRGRAQEAPGSSLEAAPMAPAVHAIGVLGSALAAGLVLASFGSEPGIYFEGALRVERFSGAFSAVIVLGAFFTSLSAAGYLKARGIEDGEFHALVLFGAGAMVLLAQSNNLIMIFLSLETFSMVVYILTGFQRDDKRSVEGALKYLILGSLASGFLLMGLALVYGATGEVRLDAIPPRIAEGAADRPLLLAGAALVLVGFGFKLGAFPFHAWIPDAYEGAPTLVSGFMAVSVKAAAFAALTRVALVFSSAGPPEVQEALAWSLSALAIGTCVFGNLVAIVQSSAKRMLAYSGIAHTGYLLIGLVAALTMKEGSYFDSRGSAIIFYFFPYALMTFGAFAIMAHAGDGSGDAESFDSFRGLSRKRPLVALSMLIFMVSLAGIPPTAGFWAKLYLFREAVAAGRWDLALVGILTSIVAVYYYLRLVVVMYMQPPPGLGETGKAPAPSAEPRAAWVPPAPVARQPARWALPAVVALAAAGVLLIGLFPDSLLTRSIESIRALLRLL